ncbi:phage tail tape measure protein, partial [Methylobacterium iners]
MANLDVALRLRLINGIKPGAQEAKRDLDALGASAKSLNNVRAGSIISRDLGVMAAAGARAGTVTARLGAELRGVAVAGARAGNDLKRLGSERAGLAGLDAVARALGRDLDQAAAAGRRLGTATDRLNDRRVAASSAAMRRLASDTERAVAATSRLAREQGRLRTGRLGAPDAEGSRRPPTRPSAPKGAGGDLRQDKAEALAAAGLTRYGPAGAAAGGVYGAGKSYVEFADVERRMTRVGLTAEASREEMRAVTREAQDLAIKYGLAFDKIADGYEALAAQGRKMPEIRAFMPSVAATAQASGAEVADIANTAGAIGEQMGIAAPRMQAAFDILVAGGKAGKFELKDMARYLPSLAPLAASVGLKGEEGLRRLVAIAQVVRNQTGTAEEAAASLNNIFAKMESKETAKNFKEMGVDLEEGMKKAREEGRDLITVFAELADKAVGGDLSKLPKLIGDMEFARGVRALLSQKGAVDKFVESFRKVDGTTMEDLGRVLDDSRAKIDRMSGSWQRFTTQLGETLSPLVTPMLESITGALKDLDDATERAKAAGAPREGRMLSDAGQAKVNRLFNTAYYGVDTPESQLVARAESGKHRREAEERKAEIVKQIALQEAEVRKMEAIQPGPFGASSKHRELIEGTKARIEGLRAQLQAVDQAAADIDAALQAFKVAKAGRARFESLRIRDDGDGLDERPKGDGTGPSGFLPGFTPSGIPVAPDRLPKPGPDRFSLDGGSGARPGMEKAMTALAERLRAERTPIVIPPSAGKSFGVSGPVAPTGAPQLPASGGPGAFPLAADLAKAKFDPQPMIIGMQQVQEEAKRLRTGLSQDLSEPARQSMATYVTALSAGTAAATATVTAAVAQMKSA